MKKIIIPAIAFAAWMALMNYDIPAKGNLIPALGRFLNPFVGVWQNVAIEKANYNLKGLVKSKVRILFDERDIPHVYADNLEDALYAQGYLHAANRLFAMEITARSAAGRLSEMIGKRTLAYDRKQRERGYEYSAIQKAESYQSNEHTKALFDAYTNGVNDYIKSLPYKSWPLEYKIFNHAPADWSILQSALVATSMAISLCIGENDLDYTNALQNLVPAEYQFLFPLHNRLESPIIPSEKKWDFKPVKSKLLGGESGDVQIGYVPPNQEEYLYGSNNWAISPGKTKDGHAILANDPHLGLTLPNIWYEMEFHIPGMHVHGVTLPGLPFVIIGFNDSIAWGSTNSGQDVLDWYKITWQDSSRKKYLLDDQFIDATLRPEEIKVRGAAAVVDTIRYTRWGPVSHIDAHTDMAMKWIGHQKASAVDLDYLEKINKAKNLQDYREAVASFQYPAQNKVFASTQGDIAISVAGVMPLRPDGLGESVTAGDKSANDWQGFIPFSEAPYIINPTRGFVSSANQVPADTTYPHPLVGRRYFEDYRGRVINMYLDTAKNITIEDIKALQQNNFDLHAAEVLPLMIKAIYASDCSPTNLLLDRLMNWNYQFDKDSLSPILFEIWYNHFDTLIWDELDAKNIMHPETWRTTEILRDDPKNKYFDLQSTPDKIETAADIACMAFTQMVEEYTALPDERKSNWGAYKASTIPHLARIPHFGVDYISTSGNKHIINAMSKSNGPSWRMIVELTSPPKAWVNYPGGQSGNPASPHFKDFLEPFFNGTYYEVDLKTDPESWKPVSQIEIAPR